MSSARRLLLRLASLRWTADFVLLLFNGGHDGRWRHLGLLPQPEAPDPPTSSSGGSDGEACAEAAQLDSGAETEAALPAKGHSI